MKNYDGRLKAIQKIANAKTGRVVFLDYKDGVYYENGKIVDINGIRADAIIIDDIPDSDTLPTPPDEKGVLECE